MLTVFNADLNEEQKMRSMGKRLERTFKRSLLKGSNVLTR